MHYTDGMGDMDYYALLGVDRSSSVEEITRAYRRLAREYHPDLHPQDADAGSRFAKINEAYQVLSDPEKRAQYDQQLAGPAASPYPWQPAPPPEEYTQNEQPVVHQQTVFVQGTDIQEAVADLAATFEEFANQAADEMRAALRGFGAELDSIAHTFGSDATANRTMRRGFRPPPQQHRKPPRQNRHPWNGRPPGEGQAPKP